jgi:hypothetical protein
MGLSVVEGLVEAFGCVVGSDDVAELGVAAVVGVAVRRYA